MADGHRYNDVGLGTDHYSYQCLENRYMISRPVICSFEAFCLCAAGCHPAFHLFALIMPGSVPEHDNTMHIVFALNSGNGRGWKVSANQGVRKSLLNLPRKPPLVTE